MKNLKCSAVSKIIKITKKNVNTFYNAGCTMFSKKKKDQIFLPSNSWKKHPQKLHRKTQIHFFSLLPAQPKQKNSCSKMWPIDQLYIVDTQLRHKSKKSENLGRCGRWNMLWPYLKFGSGSWFSSMQWRQFRNWASVVK